MSFRSTTELGIDTLLRMKHEWEENETLEKKNDAYSFVSSCLTSSDVNLKIVCAGLLAKPSSCAFLLQTLTKNPLKEARKSNGKENNGFYLYQDGGAAGAFIHALEDESVSVKLAAISSLEQIRREYVVTSDAFAVLESNWSCFSSLLEFSTALDKKPNPQKSAVYFSNRSSYKHYLTRQKIIQETKSKKRKGNKTLGQDSSFHPELVEASLHQPLADHSNTRINQDANAELQYSLCCLPLPETSPPTLPSTSLSKNPIGDIILVCF